MGKFISKDWVVKVNNVDLSDHAFNIDAPQTKDQVDVSGFNAAGTKEFLPGTEDATITVQFLQDFASNKVHQTLQPLYDSGSSFPILIQPLSAAGTSSTNPTLSGTANLFTYNGAAATLNQRGEITAEFKPAANSRFAWATA